MNIGAVFALAPSVAAQMMLDREMVCMYVQTDRQTHTCLD